MKCLVCVLLLLVVLEEVYCCDPMNPCKQGQCCVEMQSGKRKCQKLARKGEKCGTLSLDPNSPGAYSVHCGCEIPHLCVQNKCM